jgi:hypothetical protein
MDQRFSLKSGLFPGGEAEWRVPEKYILVDREYNDWASAVN